MKSRIFLSIAALIGLVLLAFAAVFVGMRFGLTNARSAADKEQTATTSPLYDTKLWKGSPEWRTFKAAIVKDKPAIDDAAQKAGVSPRLIMAICAVEQLRLYYSDRAIYEQIFSPLKILGVQSQFSWGVMGIKQETAEEIEKRAPEIDKQSLLAFTTPDPDTERFDRLTAQHDNSWSYTYGALFIKEVEAEWNKAGFPIEANPGVLATLFNIGFAHSNPHSNPQIGGAVIPFAGRTYTFGSFAHDIYYSDELLTAFPR